MGKIWYDMFPIYMLVDIDRMWSFLRKQRAKKAATHPGVVDDRQKERTSGIGCVASRTTRKERICLDQCLALGERDEGAGNGAA